MAERLKIDMGAIDELASSLKVAFDSLDHEYYFTRDVELVVGHDDVAGAVRGFENKWNRHRTDIVAFVGHLSDTLHEIAEAFSQLESDLEQGISSSGAPAASSSESGVGE